MVVYPVTNFQQGGLPSSPGPTDFSGGSPANSNNFKAYYSNYYFSPPSPSNTIRFNFTDLLLYGSQFVNLTDLAAAYSTVANPGPYILGGVMPLDSISIYVSLEEREPAGFTTGETWASDLAILIAPKDGSFLNPTLQVGAGASGFGASNWIGWSESSTLPTPYLFSDTQQLLSPVTLSATPGSTDPVIWLGNAFVTGAGSSWGKWSGYIDFTFAGSGGSGVPDASRTALLIAPGTLLLLGLAWRSRRRS